jgi:putative Holliday junction resolvase
VTDSLRIVANPLETVDTSKLIAYVKDYLSKETVDTIVVGKPKNLNGNDSDSMRYLTPVINKLRKEIAPIPVEFYDERFTSVLAHRAMLDGGMSKMARRDKAVVDRISASIILNDYLNSNQNK